MSEYQYYEFQTIDRPLSAEQQAALRRLSSRVDLTSTRAAFNYSYGSFRGEPLDVLEKHFDALLYIANWGSKQLAFRFPQALIATAQLQPYLYENEYKEALISLEVSGQYAILNMEFHEEGGYGWIEDQGLLGPLIPLREDILRGDLRALYLAWLRAAELNANDAAVEPPPPPGLGALNSALQALAEFFTIDEDLLAAAAVTSPAIEVAAESFDLWVTLLPVAERNEFLVRLARGEAHVGAELRRRLRDVGNATRSAAPAAGPRRSFADLQAAAEGQRQIRMQRQQQEAERARLAALEALARREPTIWAEIPKLLAQRTASGYEQAVQRLVELRDLAVHRGQQEQFTAQMNAVVGPYAISAALQRRLKEKRLL